MGGNCLSVSVESSLLVTMFNLPLPNSLSSDMVPCLGHRIAVPMILSFIPGREKIRFSSQRDIPGRIFPGGYTQEDIPRRILLGGYSWEDNPRRIFPGGYSQEDIPGRISLEG